MSARTAASYDDVRRPAPTGPSPVSPDDLAILALLARGLPMDTVARRVGLSERTVRRRCRQVCDRLGLDTPIEAVVWAVRRRLV